MKIVLLLSGIGGTLMRGFKSWVLAREVDLGGLVRGSVALDNILPQG